MEDLATHPTERSVNSLSPSMEDPTAPAQQLPTLGTITAQHGALHLPTATVHGMTQLLLATKTPGDIATTTQLRGQNPAAEQHLASLAFSLSTT